MKPDNKPKKARITPEIRNRIIGLSITAVVVGLLALLITRCNIDMYDSDNYVNAIREKDLKKVKELIDKGVNVNVTSETNAAPLFCAIENGQTSIAKLLLEKGADLKKKNHDGQTPMEYAAVFHNEVMTRLLGEYQALRAPEAGPVKKLWERGIVYNIENFIQAVKNNDRESIDLFLSAGIDLNKKDIGNEAALNAALLAGHKELLAFLIERTQKLSKKTLGSALLAAAAAGDLDSMQILVAAKAGIDYRDEQGNTALLHAPTLPVLEYLLQTGANVNAVNNAKENALMCIILNPGIDNMSGVKMIEALLKGGFDLAVDNGASMVMARERGRPEIEKLLGSAEMDEEFTEENFFGRVAANNIRAVENLLDKGVYVDAVNAQKETALIIAVKKGYTEMAALLIGKGAFVDHRDTEGKTALNHATYTLAKGEARDKIMALLEKAGAKM